MHQYRVIEDPEVVSGTDNDRTFSMKNGFGRENGGHQDSKIHEPLDRGNNESKIFKGKCGSPISETSEFRHLDDSKMRSDDENVRGECVDTPLRKSEENHDHEMQRKFQIKNNIYDTTDYEGIKLLNGIEKVIFTSETTNCHNEKTSSSNDSTSRDETTEDQQENKPKGKLKKRRALTLADIFLSVFVVAPFVVGYWRGVWTLMDLNPEMFPTWACFVVGVGVHTVFAVLRHHLHAKFALELKAVGFFSRLGYRFVRLLYTFVFSAACIMHWRGGWAIFDDCSIHAWITRWMTVICLLILILLRCVRNLTAAPFIVAIDKRGYVFNFPTRFNVNTRDWSLYILDCAFSVGVVGTLVVFVWRGVWVIFDLYLFPENAEYSAVGSIVIGYTIVIITFSLQPLMRYACTRLKGLSRLVAADIFLLLSFVGTVNVWRGVWNVLGLWLFPEDPELSCWITHLGCFVFLVLLNCSNSILVRGVYIDAEEAEGKCAVFPCHYLRLFFKIEREKKEARRQNLVVASRDLATITERNGKEENGALLNVSSASGVAANPESLV